MKPWCTHGFCSLPAVAVLCVAAVVEVAMASARVQTFLSAMESGGMADAASLHWVEEHEAREEPKGSMVPGGRRNAVRWPRVSQIDFHLCVVFGICWVVVLGGTPIFIYKYDNRAVTRTGLVLSGLLWMALFGGLFAFTQVVIFESPHFDEARPLTIIECTYFMTQVITTVGYGDIVPARTRGQLFVGCYVVLAFFVIALLVSEMQAMIVNNMEQYKVTLTKHIGVNLRTATPRLGLYKPKRPSPLNMIMSATGYAAIAITWILFYHYWPGEDKSWVDATYMVLITLTSVGFGAVTPLTEGGMIFASFFMFIGSAALVSVVANFSTFMLQMTEWEAWDPTLFDRDLQKMQAACEVSDGAEISESDFMTIVLVHKNIISQSQVDAIRHSYRKMKRKIGNVDLEHLRSRIMKDEQSESDVSAPPSQMATPR